MRTRELLILACLALFAVAIPAPLAAGVELNGKSSEIVVPSLRFPGDSPLTVEFIVTPERGDGFARLLSNTNYVRKQRSGFAIGLREGYWMVSVETARGWRKLISKRPVVLGKRVHLAVVFDRKRVRLFVNGRLDPQTLEMTEPHVPSTVDFLLGSERLFNGKRGFYFSGTLDGFRASQNARYDKTFTPPETLDPDDKTLLMYDFSAGEGTVCRDKSPFSFDGKATDIKWTPAEARYEYAPVEELEPFVGLFEVERTLKGGGKIASVFYEFREEGEIRENNKPIGTWELTERAIAIKMDSAPSEVVELKVQKDETLQGTQTTGNSAVEWKLIRIQVAQLWEQQFVKQNRGFTVILWSNGTIQNYTGDDRWELLRRKLTFKWASGLESKLELARDEQTYEGVTGRNQKVVGTRLY